MEPWDSYLKLISIELGQGFTENLKINDFV